MPRCCCVLKGCRTCKQFITKQYAAFGPLLHPNDSQNNTLRWAVFSDWQGNGDLYLTHMLVQTGFSLWSRSVPSMGTFWVDWWSVGALSQDVFWSGMPRSVRMNSFMTFDIMKNYLPKDILQLFQPLRLYNFLFIAVWYWLPNHTCR